MHSKVTIINDKLKIVKRALKHFFENKKYINLPYKIVNLIKT